MSDIYASAKYLRNAASSYGARMTNVPRIKIYESRGTFVGDLPVEYVERKGLGHPDSLMDGICERSSIELSKYYLEHFGAILHHNVDKGLLVGGAAKAKPGSGKITKPIEIVIAGRATREFDGKKIPVDQIVIKAAKDYLKENTRFLDIENETRISTRILGGSADLTELFARSTVAPLANDTSIGVGFSPMTNAERLTLETERFLNSKAYKKRMPATGEDIKVMCSRNDGNIELNVAVAFVAHLVSGIEEYSELKDRVVSDVERFSKSILGETAGVSVNTGDSMERGEIYLTKSGLCCEAGDDGQPGRGNRVNGLITPFRAMSMESSAGKNPVSHTGKLYNVIASEASERISRIRGIRDCNVTMLSYIGERIDRPHGTSVSVALSKGTGIKDVEEAVMDVITDTVGNISSVSKRILDGKCSVF